MKCGVDVATRMKAPRGMEQSMQRVLYSFPYCCRFRKRTSFEVASCFRWRGKFVTASVLSNRTGKPLPCHKLSAIHVHRRIAATTSCGKYLSRLFIALHLPQLLCPAKSLICTPRNEIQDFYWASWHRLFYFKLLLP